MNYFISLFERQKEKTQHLLLHSSNACRSWCGAGCNPRVGNSIQVDHVDGCNPIESWSQKTGSGIESQHSAMGHRYLNQLLNYWATHLLQFSASSFHSSVPGNSHSYNLWYLGTEDWDISFSCLPHHPLSPSSDVITLFTPNTLI